MTTTNTNKNIIFTYDELLHAIEDPNGRAISDPATGDLIGYTHVGTIAEMEDAVAKAQRKQPSWAALSHAERSRFLHKAADAIEASSEGLAELLSRENGKPLNGLNARFEVQACADWLRANANFEIEPEVVVDDESGRAEIHYEPVGVVAAIGPWNWPMMISVWQFAPALRMGNVVVLKPAGTTPLSVQALIHVVNQVLPNNVLHVVPGNGKVGAAMVNHSDIDKVMFTGSTPTGRAIMRSAADNLARLTLELGGNDAGIVLEDADPRQIAEDLFWGAFVNTGQTCSALKRLYVPESLYEDVCEALVEVANNTPMGPGMDEENLLGPLQNKAQYDIVNSLVESAKNAGAEILTGGNPNENQAGYFYPATLVSNIDHDNPLVAEEQFGPALPIIKYQDLDQAIEWANAFDVGLGSSVWGPDIQECKRVAQQLEAGMTWINKHAIVDPRIPFGGIKDSGFGLEFGVHGLKEVALPHVISW